MIDFFFSPLRMRAFIALLGLGRTPTLLNQLLSLPHHQGADRMTLERVARFYLDEFQVSHTYTLYYIMKNKKMCLTSEWWWW